MIEIRLQDEKYWKKYEKNESKKKINRITLQRIEKILR